jgi:hypothetical protein
VPYDIASLFGPDPEGMGIPPKIVQGQIVTFDTATGHNTVSVMGATLTDVPMLATGAEILYTAGDPVMLLVIGNTYSLLGKVVSAGSTRYAGATVSAAANGNSASNFAVGTSTAALATASIAVPTWATKAAVTIYAIAVTHDVGATDRDVIVTAEMNGNLVSDATYYGAHTHTCEGFTGGSFIWSLSGETQLSATVAVSLASGSIATNASNYAQVNILANYYKS